MKLNDVHQSHRQPGPDARHQQHQEMREPIAECHILLPQEYMGNVITLCIEKRGVQTNIVYPASRWR
ncbi:hypothetical protein ACNKHQ_15105 [Shigella flexneri]